MVLPVLHLPTIEPMFSVFAGIQLGFERVGTCNLLCCAAYGPIRAEISPIGI